MEKCSTTERYYRTHKCECCPMHNTNNIEMHSKENETKSSDMVGFKGTKQRVTCGKD
jgi:hypothetical protein